MNESCLKCGEDLSHLMNLDHIFDEIRCPKCGNKMIVNYDGYSDEEWSYDSWLWLEQV